MTGKVTEGLVRRQAKSQKPFFIWWAPAAPHREDVVDDAHGPPGRRPASGAALRGSAARATRCPGRRASTSPTSRQAVEHARPRAQARPTTQIQQLQLDYEGRSGSLLAVDDHVKKLVSILRATHQLDNTLIVFVSDNGWLQGAARASRATSTCPTRSRCGSRSSCAAPASRAARPCTARSRTSTSRRRCCPTRKRAPGRTMDGVSLLPTIRNPAQAAAAHDRDRGHRAAVRGRRPRQRAGTGPWSGVRTDRYTYVRLQGGRRRAALRPPRDPFELDNLAGRPGLRVGQGRHGGAARQARPLQGEDVQRSGLILAGISLARRRCSLTIALVRAARASAQRPTSTTRATARCSS